MPENLIPLRLPFESPALSVAVHAEGDQVVSAAIARDGLWEPFETRLIWDSLSPGSVFVDVGANLGYFTVLAAARVGPDGQVFAFEPDPDNCSLLTRTLSENTLQERVSVEQAALGHVDADARLYLSEDNYGDHQIYPSGDRRRSMAIRCLRGDAYFADKTDAIDLVKVDTQGSEYAVLSGLIAFLRSQCGSPRLLVELTPYSLRAAGASGRALVQLLAELALPFWIVDHIEHRLVPSDEESLARWCDNVDACPDDEGFMNIFVGQPPSGWQGVDSLHPPRS